MDASVVVSTSSTQGWGHSNLPVATLVLPSLPQGWSWWAWHMPGAAWQPFVVQPPSRTVIATRMASVCRRRRRPTSRGWLRPPRTIGMIPARQARRRASAAEMRAPVSRVHTPADSRSASSCSSLMVTTTVAPQPPAFGRSSAEMASRSWVRAMPWRTGVGRSGSMPESRSITTVPSAARRVVARLGEARARIILISICPCSAGMRNRPWQVPSSSSHSDKVVRRRAWASSRSSARPSNCSATSGAMTSKTRRPRMRSSLASWWAARSTRCCSAATRCSWLTANAARARQPIQRGDDRAGLRDVHPTTGHGGGKHVVVLEALGVTQVRAGVAAHLPGLDRHPVGRGRRAGVHGRLALLGICQQAQPHRLQLSVGAGELDQRGPLLLRAHREQRHFRQPVEATGQAACELGHRVLLVVVVPAAAHG